MRPSLSGVSVEAQRVLPEREVAAACGVFLPEGGGSTLEQTRCCSWARLV